MEYEISNAKLKPVPEKYRTNPEDHPYQLSFNNSTIIQPVPGSQPATGPDYIVLASIPRTMTIDDRYDVLGIVIYVEPLRTIKRQTGQELEVREIVIADHSTTQPMTVTVWADLAVKEGATVQSMAESFPVVGFTSLRTCYHKGFSLATTNATFFKFDPTGEKADAIRAWKKANEGIVAAKAQQVLEVRLPETQRRTITIKTLREKKVVTTLQEERHWLHVKIPEFDKKDVRFYLGCNNCGTRSDKDVDATYTCQACGREGAVSSPRMNVTFEAIDATGSYAFTAFTEDAEKLLETKASALYSLPIEVFTKKKFKAIQFTLTV
ncbi:replication protein A 70 kDa DNA-binding subunit A-like [Silene latifolia]|uniref:replication protein A 70 kDa DNA-binding subunit A-like n=1 Tax=Silene latifolia TaxID=37657 RepID=UPI003D77247C